MSTAVDVTMKVLYVKGTVADVDSATMTQLRAVAPGLEMTAVQGSAEALAEVRRPNGWQALLVSPSLPQNETLALIASVRRDRVPLAIVPVVDEGQKDLYAAAVASGADDVLLRRGQTLVNVTETLARIQQSPHLAQADQRRRIGVLYAGRDTLVWNLLEQVPFIKAERVACGIDGSCPVRAHGSNDGSLRTDAVVIDEQPGDAHPLQVLKSVKAQASDLPVIVLTSTGSSDIATAALELGADDTVLKTGIFRRRLIATLRRVHQRIELTSQQTEMKAREERLRQIVENVPAGITVIGADGAVLAMNAAALALFGAAKPRDVVGKDFRQFGIAEHHPALTDFIRRVTKGESTAIEFAGLTLAGAQVPLTIRGVVLERDARGGRGVIASVFPAGTVPLAPVADTGTSSDELMTLQASLQRMETHYAELEEKRSEEQAAWDVERRRLEERLEQAELLGKEREDLARRLDEITAELARTSHTFAAERQALEARLQELEDRAREAATAGAARSDVEATLDDVRDELRQAIEAHALERSGWQAIREDLEGRVNEMDSVSRLHDQEAANVAALTTELGQLTGQIESERSAWTARRTELETELRDAREALWAEHNERDAQRAAADAELGQIRDLLSTERAEWAAARAERDAALSAATLDIDQLRASLAAVANSGDADARAQLTLDLEAARTDLEVTRAELDRQREGRAELDAALAAARLELDQARTSLAAAVDRGADERAHLTRDLDAARAELDATRAELDRHREGRTELNAALAAAKLDLDQLRASFAAAVSGGDEERAQLTRDLDAARAELDRQREERTELDAALAAARLDLDRLRDGRAEFEARLTADLERAQEATRAIGDEYDATRVRLEHDRDEARRSAESALTELGAAHAAAALAIETAKNEAGFDIARLEVQLAEATAELERTRHRVMERDALRAELDAARDAIATLESTHSHDWQSWEAAKRALESTISDRDSAMAAERRAWDRERSELFERGRDGADLRQAHDRLQVGLDALRVDYATLGQQLANERASRERDQRQIEALQAQLEDAGRDRAGLERDLEETTREAEGLLRRRDLEYAERVRDLERRLSDESSRVAQLSDEADRNRAALGSEAARLTENYTRLVASDLFGYALTAENGELVRCNDAFARIFGYASSNDAMMRTKGRPFPGLAGRPSFDTRLGAEGRLARVESCLSRVDGQPIRVIETVTRLSHGLRDIDIRPLIEHVMLAAAAAPDSEELQGRRLQDVGALASAMVPEIEGLVTSLHERAHDANHAPEETARLAAQVAALVRQLGAYSRRQGRSTEPTDIAQVVLRTEPMLVRLAGDYIAFRTDLKPTSAVATPAADLDQLLTSLVTFGRDVLPAGGSILVETRQQEAGKDGSLTALDGPVIVVTASGYGVQTPERPSALEQVAARCGGHLSMTSEPGWLVRLEVSFSRCGTRDKSAWRWITGAD